MSWNPAFILLILASTLIDFTAAPKIIAATSRAHKKSWLVLSLALNLGLLGFFKYANFVIDTSNALFGRWVQFANLNITLPVGISFYTFQTMTYSLDAYFGAIAVERNFIKFALYVAFFPQLVAGPIVRAQEFLPQLYRPATITNAKVYAGFERFVMGLVKKLLIADAVAPYVDRIFASPGQFDGATLWLATIAFGMQIYCDFSGYSDMAIGAAKCLGYDFPENFNMPYAATNISNFWQRWHMTLSRWLRDYLYIRLGGSRCTEPSVVRNLMVTMLLGGLWHGASWKFVIWGGLHGLYLVAYRMWSIAKLQRGFSLPAWVKQPAAIGAASLTFACVTLTWVYFRADSAATASAMIYRMLTLDSTGEFIIDPIMMICLTVMFASHIVGQVTDPENLLRNLPTPLKVVGFSVIFYLISISSIRDNTPFIYFQF